MEDLRELCDRLLAMGRVHDRHRVVLERLSVLFETIPYVELKKLDEFDQLALELEQLEARRIELEPVIRVGIQREMVCLMMLAPILHKRGIHVKGLIEPIVSLSTKPETVVDVNVRAALISILEAVGVACRLRTAAPNHAWMRKMFLYGFLQEDGKFRFIVLRDTYILFMDNEIPALVTFVIIK